MLEGSKNINSSHLNSTSCNVIKYTNLVPKLIYHNPHDRRLEEAEINDVRKCHDKRQFPTPQLIASNFVPIFARHHSYIYRMPNSRRVPLSANPRALLVRRIVWHKADVATLLRLILLKIHS